jgi:hypothetical protein
MLVQLIDQDTYLGISQKTSLYHVLAYKFHGRTEEVSECWFGPLLTVIVPGLVIADDCWYVGQSAGAAYLSSCLGYRRFELYPQKWANPQSRFAVRSPA